MSFNKWGRAPKSDRLQAGMALEALEFFVFLIIVQIRVELCRAATLSPAQSR